ncbi:MAG: alpha/beta fold hydrolase [Gammaproteobacteria bacterium]|nr:alpha/beta fold hydrolase [Gammaproteobacteria bacterium]
MTRDLMLLHGWAVTGRVWESVIPELATAFRVHNPGLPGYGGTDPNAGRYGALSGQAILDLWSDECLARFPGGATWVGWSLGALVTLNAMLRSPGAIAAAVLVSATPRFLRGDDWAPGVDTHVMRGFLEGMRSNDEKTLRRFTLLQSDDRRTSRALRACVAGGGAVPVLEAGLRVLEEADLRPELGRIDVPVRVVHGARDRIVPPAAGAWLAAHVAGGESVTLDAGHAPFVECPREFTEAVLQWR